MKKPMLVILTAMLLFTTACSDSDKFQLLSDKYPQDNTFHPEYDCPYYLETTNADNQIAQTENGFYFLIGSFLMYADSEQMNPIPVCPKPNCRHNEETDSAKRQMCEAYFEQILGCSGVFYYNDDVYVLHRMYDEDKDSGEKITVNALTKVDPANMKRYTVLKTEGTLGLIVTSNYLPQRTV